MIVIVRTSCPWKLNISFIVFLSKFGIIKIIN
nr:MAG TPA: hypothetical protein [Caudoviricetes sp.]